MGALCSKSSTHTGGHTVLSSSGGDTLRSSNAVSSSAPNDPRAAAAAAAEQRMKAAAQRGVNKSNPNHGQLAAKLDANKRAPRVPEAREEERLVWD